MRDSVIASRARIRNALHSRWAIAEVVAEVIPIIVRIRTREDRGRGEDESNRMSRRGTERRIDPIELGLLVEG